MTKENKTLNEARLHAKNKNYAKSARLFAKCLENENAQNPQILLELGFALLLAGDEDGAVRIYEALSVLLKDLSDLPQRIAQMWSKYEHLIAGAKRKLVLTGVTAALLSGTACGEQPVHSAHRYSGGVSRPTLQESVRPQRPDNKTPFQFQYSGHKYSGGVLSDENIQHIHDIIKSNAPSSSVKETVPGTSAAPGESTTSPKAGDSASPSPQATSEVKIQPFLNNRPHSAHRYSGGVYFNNRDFLRREPAPQKNEESQTKGTSDK